MAVSVHSIHESHLNWQCVAGKAYVRRLIDYLNQGKESTLAVNYAPASGANYRCQTLANKIAVCKPRKYERFQRVVSHESIECCVKVLF